MNKKLFAYLILPLLSLPAVLAQSSSSFFGLLGNVFEDLVKPESIISKILSVPAAGDETVFKLALWVILFVIFFNAGTRTIFTDPSQRKIAGFLAAFIALIGAWFFNFSQLQNIGVIYATLILFALYLGPILAVFYLMYGGWGERGRNPFEEPTTLNFALKAIFSGILLWLIGTLAKEVGVGSFSGYRRDVLFNALSGQRWLTDITAYIFTVLFLMLVYYLIRFIISLVGSISGGGYSEGEARFGRGAARAGRGAGSFFRSIGSALGRGGRGAARGLYNRATRGTREAERETEQEILGIRETESELEDIPILLQRLRNPRNNEEVTQSARRIMEIVQSAGARERQYISHVSPQIETALRSLRAFLEHIRRDHVVEQLQHISHHEAFREYPEDLRNRILTFLRDIIPLMEQATNITDFFVERMGGTRGLCVRLIRQLGEIPTQVEDALRHVNYDEVENLINQMDEIMQTLVGTLRETSDRLNELRDMINRIRIMENLENDINTGIRNFRGPSREPESGGREPEPRGQESHQRESIRRDLNAIIRYLRESEARNNLSRGDYMKLVSIIGEIEDLINQNNLENANRRLQELIEELSRLTGHRFR